MGCCTSHSNPESAVVQAQRPTRPSTQNPTITKGKPDNMAAKVIKTESSVKTENKKDEKQNNDFSDKPNKKPKKTVPDHKKGKTSEITASKSNHEMAVPLQDDSKEDIQIEDKREVEKPNRDTIDSHQIIANNKMKQQIEESKQGTIENNISTEVYKTDAQKQSVYDIENVEDYNIKKKTISQEEKPDGHKEVIQYELTSENQDLPPQDDQIEFLNDSKVGFSPEHKNNPESVGNDKNTFDGVKTKNVLKDELDQESDQLAGQPEVSFDHANNNELNEESDKKENSSLQNIPPQNESPVALNNDGSSPKLQNNSINESEPNNVNITRTSVAVSAAAKCYLNDVFDYAIDNDSDLASSVHEESVKLHSNNNESSINDQNMGLNGVGTNLNETLQSTSTLNKVAFNYLDDVFENACEEMSNDS